MGEFENVTEEKKRGPEIRGQKIFTRKTSQQEIQFFMESRA